MDACLEAVDRKIWRRIQFVLKIFLASNTHPHRCFCFSRFGKRVLKIWSSAFWLFSWTFHNKLWCQGAGFVTVTSYFRELKSVLILIVKDLCCSVKSWYLLIFHIQTAEQYSVWNIFFMDRWFFLWFVFLSLYGSSTAFSLSPLLFSWRSNPWNAERRTQHGLSVPEVIRGDGFRIHVLVER